MAKVSRQAWPKVTQKNAFPLGLAILRGPISHNTASSLLANGSGTSLVLKSGKAQSHSGEGEACSAVLFLWPHQAGGRPGSFIFWPMELILDQGTAVLPGTEWNMGGHMEGKAGTSMIRSWLIHAYPGPTYKAQPSWS